MKNKTNYTNTFGMLRDACRNPDTEQSLNKEGVQGSVKNDPHPRSPKMPFSFSVNVKGHSLNV